MSLLKKLMKYGVVAKAVEQAKKPENQQKAKEGLATLQDKYKERQRNKQGRIDPHQ